MIEFLNPADAPAPGAFARATRAAGLVFVSGTGAGNDIGGTAARHGRRADALGPETWRRFSSPRARRSIGWCR